MADSDQFYLDVIPDLKEALDEFGKPFTIQGAGEYNPDTLTNTKGKPRSAMGIVANASDVYKSGADNFDLSKKVLLLSPDAKLQEGEKVEVDGVWHSLESLDTVKPAAITLLYILGLEA